MEDNINYFQMKDNLKFVLDNRRSRFSVLKFILTQLNFFKRKMTSNENEENTNLFSNERRLIIFLSMEDNL